MAKQKVAQPSKAAPKFWNMITNDKEDSAEITLYGDVYSEKPRDWWTGEALEGQYITPEGFLEDLAKVKDKAQIIVRINSCGGDLYTGIAIHNAIKALKGHKTTIVDGIAASAASIIACAGDDVQMYPGSIMMIHGVAATFYDALTLQDLKQALKSLDADERAMAEIYSAKTGIDAETIRNMMTKETWMTGREAVEKGFADTLLGGNGDPETKISADKRILIVAGIRHDVRAYKHIPGGIPVFNETNAEPVTAGDKKFLKEVPPMTEQELRAQYPELVAAIESAASEKARTEATAAERARLKAIESIEPMIGDRSLIENAKYGEKVLDAAQLALLSYQEEAKRKQAQLQKMDADAKASNSAAVTGQPNSGNDDTYTNEEQVVANMVNAYNVMKGGKTK